MPEYKPAYANSHALVIGIDYYVNDRDLKTAVRGAEAVGARLSVLGFAVERRLDREATRDAVLAWFTEVADQTGPDDRVFVYFAGHAMSRRAVRGVPPVGYLKLYNTLTYSNALSLEDLLGEARFIPAKHVFFALDTCFSGLPVPQARPALPEDARPVADLLRAPATEALTAGQAGEHVGDRLRGSDYAPFTHFLLAGLEGRAARPDGVVTSDALAAYVVGAMRARRRVHQTPAFYRKGSPEGGVVGAMVFYPPA
ncbi:MAG: caspase family protein [Anaerolineae bacterium]|nr:caspase family protein [Anaerolineae bacterium]